MNRRVVGNLVKEVVDEYLAHVATVQRNGDFQTQVTDPVFLYPTVVSVAETDTQYVVEISGATEKYRPLRVTQNRNISDLNSYLGQFRFPEVERRKALFTWEASAYIRMKSLGFASQGSIDAAEGRFPGLKEFKDTILVLPPVEGEGPLFDIKPDLHFLNFIDVMLYNSYRGSVRTRYLKFLLIFQKSSSEEELRGYFAAFLDEPEIQLVQVVESGQAALQLQEAHFASQFLSGAREPQIGAYLNDHPEIMMRALDSPRVVYEPYLEWQPGTPSKGDVAINPDYFVERTDGCYDIYDLKLPLLDKNVTKGERRRRRFVDSVAEGAAQLAHYIDYFSYPENRAYAEQKYGIRISQPRATLLVGNRENISYDEIDEALRAYKDLSILDYDTLLRLYVSKSMPRES